MPLFYAPSPTPSLSLSLSLSTTARRVDGHEIVKGSDPDAPGPWLKVSSARACMCARECVLFVCARGYGALGSWV